MSSGFESDPHSQKGHACPRNFFGITSFEEMEAKESVYVPKRIVELRLNGLPGNFDLAHLRAIHRYLFQDVFPWAGEFRVVVISKVGGAPFAYPQHIASALTEAFYKLKAEDYLRGLARGQFAQRAAYYLGEINAVHPFREGNGRTQREFIRLLGARTGHRLSWKTLTKEENVAASILSHTRLDNSGLATIIEAAILKTESPEGKE
jgi:cell filamentation protein